MRLLSKIILTMIIGFSISMCAMMPRSTLDSDSGDIVKSQTTKGKYKIYVYPLDSKIVSKNNKSQYLYLIGSYDQISITVWGHPEFSSPSGLSPVSGNRYNMSGTLVSQVNQTLNPNRNANKAFLYDPGTSAYTVDEDGSVFLPLAGSIKVLNKTPKQVRQDIAKKLVDYVVNPQVNVNMVSFRGKFVYVLGEVSQAIMIPVNDIPLDLALALSISGWVNLAAADVKNIYVLRRGVAPNVEVYQLNATNPTALVFASEFVLQPSDVVFVSTAGVAQFDRVMTHFLNAAETLWYTRTAINPTNNIVPWVD